MARTVGIGIQDYAEITENNGFYVDKTSFIREWWENRDKVTLLTRPRRFGKTLMMSMVEQFFSVRYAGRSDLFEGMSVWDDEYYRGLQGTYPVVNLSLAIVMDSFWDLWSIWLTVTSSLLTGKAVLGDMMCCWRRST